MSSSLIQPIYTDHMNTKQMHLLLVLILRFVQGMLLYITMVCRFQPSMKTTTCLITTVLPPTMAGSGIKPVRLFVLLAAGGSHQPTKR